MNHWSAFILIAAGRAVDQDSQGHTIKPDEAIYSSGPIQASFVVRARLKHRSSVSGISATSFLEIYGGSMVAKLPLSAPCSLPVTRGQLTLYNNAIQASQHRTRVFGIYIRRQMCRLLCHTRGGTLVSRLFDYTRRPYLVQFLVRFSRCSPAARGHDDTIRPVSSRDPYSSEACDATMLHSTEPMIQVPVHTLDQVGQTISKYYIMRDVPFTRSHCYPIGRRTRCYVAYGCQTGAVVLFKDTWRVTAYPKEGEVYDRLHQHQVRHIAKVVLTGMYQPKPAGTSLSF